MPHQHVSHILAVPYNNSTGGENWRCRMRGPHRKDNSCNEKMCASGERQGIYRHVESAMKKDIDMMVSGGME